MNRLGPGERSHLEEIAWACCLSLISLAVGLGILLRDPASRLSRWVDGNLLPDGVSR